MRSRSARLIEEPPHFTSTVKSFPKDSFADGRAAFTLPCFACPSFICLGPAYHAIKPSAGVPAAVFLSACLESLFLFGAETKNAHIAKTKLPRGPSSGFNLHLSHLALALVFTSQETPSPRRVFECFVTRARSPLKPFLGND
eukprot:UN17180